MILALFIALTSFSQTIKEIQDKMLKLAGQNDTQELPQLFIEHKDKLEPYVRYCCGAVVSIVSGNNLESLIYIDSLLTVTSHFFDKNSKSSFAYYKATVLQQEERYEELVVFCEKYINEERLVPDDYLEKELQVLKIDGINHLRPQSIKGQLLWLANYGNPFELKTMYEMHKDSVDSYTRLNCERSLAQAFNNNQKALVCIDSLINVYFSQMDIQTMRSNIYLKAEMLLHEGEYNMLSEYVESLPEDYKTASDLNYACQWARSLKGTSSAEIMRSSQDSVIYNIAQSAKNPLFPGKVNNTVTRFLFDTGAPYTMIKGLLAQEAKVRVLSDSVTIIWNLGDLSVRGSLAIIDSLRIGNILLKNRIAIVDYSPEAPLDENTICLGAPEIKSIGQIVFYPDRVILPYNLMAKNEEPNFFLKGTEIRVPCVIGEKSHPFVFDTGADTDFLSTSVFSSSGQSLYDAKISIDKKLVRLTAVNLRENENRLGYSFVNLFPKFVIDYNTMRMDFDIDSLRIPQLYWIMRRNFFELEECLQQNNLSYYNFGKASILNGKNKPGELLSFLDTVFNNMNENEESDILLRLRALQENAFYDLGQYENAYNCLSEMRLICPETLLPSLEEVRKKCKVLRAIKSQQIVWKANQAILRPVKIVDGEFYYPLEINGENAFANITPGAYECVISMKEALRLGMTILPDSIDFNGVVSRLGVAETINMGKVAAKNVVFCVLPEDSTITLIGQSLLRLVSTIELSKDQLVLRKNKHKKGDNVIPLRLEKPNLLVQINSSKGNTIVELVNGNGGILPQSFATEKEIKVGGLPIDIGEFDLNLDLDMIIDMRGTLGLYSLLRYANCIVFDLENMTLTIIK